jgi:hypothetical protein
MMTLVYGSNCYYNFMMWIRNWGGGGGGKVRVGCRSPE